MNRKINALLYIIFGAFVIFWDQLTKRWALAGLMHGSHQLASWLKLRLVFNRGISWGVLSSPHASVFWAVTFTIIALTLFVAVMAYSGFLKHRSVVGEVLVVAGSVSNLIDRFVHHAVVDFVEISYKGWAWPAFNFADCCIVLGVILILLTQCRH